MVTLLRNASPLAIRCLRPERMDDPHLDAQLHREALTGLARLNAVSGCAPALWKRIAPIAAASAKPLRVLDVATGAGDIPVRLARIAATKNTAVRWYGCDISPVAVGRAWRLAEKHSVRVQFFQCDALGGEPFGDFDVVLCSLFLHHLDEDRAIRLFTNLAAAAGRMILLTDLHRSGLNYLIVRTASLLVTRSPVVRFDAPTSVRAAFTAKEALSLARRAGLDGCHVARLFPCRYLLSWSRP